MIKAFCEWGLQGARTCGGHVAVIVVVDVLSFSTCVDIAVSRGACVYPFADGDLAAATRAAEAIGAEVAGPRSSAVFPYSLSPGSLLSIPSGTKLLLPSPNGSAISAAGSGIPTLAGCLRNAGAVAEKAAALARGGAIAVIPAGERWPDGSLRPAIEDLLGAGAVLDALGADCSPEAEVARDAFRHFRPRLGPLLRGCASGLELIGRGYAADVEAALAVNVSTAAPLLRDGAYSA